MEANQSETFKSESYPNALKYLGILARCFFSSLSLFLIVNLRWHDIFQFMPFTFFYKDCYWTNLWQGCAESDDMEEIENVSSHCSLNSKWSFNSVVDRSKLTYLPFHEVRGDCSPSTSGAYVSAIFMHHPTLVCFLLFYGRRPCVCLPTLES